MYIYTINNLGYILLINHLRIIISLYYILTKTQYNFICVAKQGEIIKLALQSVTDNKIYCINTISLDTVLEIVLWGIDIILFSIKGNWDIVTYKKIPSIVMNLKVPQTLAY